MQQALSHSKSSSENGHAAPFFVDLKLLKNCCTAKMSELCGKVNLFECITAIVRDRQECDWKCRVVDLLELLSPFFLAVADSRAVTREGIHGDWISRDVSWKLYSSNSNAKPKAFCVATIFTYVFNSIGSQRREKIFDKCKIPQYLDLDRFCELFQIHRVNWSFQESSTSLTAQTIFFRKYRVF